MLKRHLLILLTALAVSFNVLAQESPEAFAAALKEAFARKDTAKLEALFYSAGMSGEEKQQALAEAQQGFASLGDIESVTLLPMPAGFLPVIVTGGRRVETTAPPAGQVVLKFRTSDQRSTSGYPVYGIVDGRYYLLGKKSRAVEWAGPADQKLSYELTGEGLDGLRTSLKWNGSGVDQEHTFTAASYSLFGQFIREISVTSDNEKTDAILTVLENDKPIFASKPLKGKGTLGYKRPN